jgi:hypothetical protein
MPCFTADDEIVAIVVHAPMSGHEIGRSKGVTIEKQNDFAAGTRRPGVGSG